MPSFADALNTAPLQHVPLQQQPAAGVSEAATTSSQEDASVQQPKDDEPLLLINPAQLSRSSSHVMPSPRVMQPGADPVCALDAGALSRPAAAVAAAEGFPLVGNTIAEGPSSLMSAQPVPSTAAAGLTPQDFGSSNLLAAVNAVASRLSLRHTASQSSYAGLPSISEEASAGAHDNTAAFSSQQQSDAAGAAMSGALHGLMFTAPAPGFRRSISNLRTGGSLTAPAAAELPRVASLSGQVYRRTSHDAQLSVNHMQGVVCGIRTVHAAGSSTRQTANHIAARTARTAPTVRVETGALRSFY